jgi:LmbE family N-acetylglucosaminyl deacetylase
LGLALVFGSRAPAQDAGFPDSSKLEIALEKLNVLGSVLYVAAHPDDENTAALAYFSKGRKLRTACLSFTRGEGGQNLIGTEQGAELGILRTQELMAARRIDGAEQFFTRAVDFGYSKTAEETFEFWGKEKTLREVVRVIRSFRPDVIISRFTPENSGGHGHHTASAILIQEAFEAAGDPDRFPEQLKSVAPWKAKRLFWNSWRPSPEEMKNLIRIDTGEYDPLLGESYSEMAAEGRSQHKSQGFGSAARRGAQTDFFKLTAGDPAAEDLFQGIDLTWNRVPGGRKAGLLLAESLKTFDPRDPSKSIPGLMRAYAEIAGLPEENWTRLKKRELSDVIGACAGIWLEAIAADYAAAPGDSIQVKMTGINRSGYPFTLHSVGFPPLVPDSGPDRSLKNNEPLTVENTVSLPRDLALSQPYWLDDSQGGVTDRPASLSARIILSADGHLLEYSVPLLYRWTDPVDGESYRPFEIRPKVTIQVEDKVVIFAGSAPRNVKIRLKGNSPNISGRVRLKCPEGWRSDPADAPFTLTAKYGEAEASFRITPPGRAGEADLAVEAEIDGEKISRSMVEIAYPHIRRQVYFPPSRLKAVKLDIKTEGKKLGYIMGAGDEVPEALRSLGYEVTALTDAMLEKSDLSGFDAVIAGVRAYNTREVLRNAQGRLLRYVELGGTLIVQYNVSSGLLVDSIGPFPLSLGRDRVCQENAPVVLSAQEHPLLHFPNKIGPADFDGWVQERGLYFASQWDARYESILSSHDSGEPERKGGLLYARYGRGAYIYSGYAWFRQLPAGVAGAFRLFANMISAGKTDGKPPGK